MNEEGQDRIHSYPSIYALGHKAIEDLTKSPVIVEEKVDGSQFSFGRSESGELLCRSKGKQLIIDAPEKLFLRAIEGVTPLDLHLGWTYRGEYLQKPKHGALAYDRVPAHNVILFDINTGLEEYLGPAEKHAEAERLGLECVPVLQEGLLETREQFHALLDTISVLGGQKIEGVVIKPLGYSLFGKDKKVLMGKYVSEAFKEIHGGEWRMANPTRSDIIQRLIERYKTPARWNKAVQHLKEQGRLESSPRDIGALILEVKADIEKECAEEIRDALFSYAWPQIARAVTGGLPQWYKDELVKVQFGG